jgi:hypothetical protein
VHGSTVSGTVVETVYLGMYTQVHADTQLGRIVSHAEDPPSLGASVSLAWDADDAYVITGK